MQYTQIYQQVSAAAAVAIAAGYIRHDLGCYYYVKTRRIFKTGHGRYFTFVVSKFQGDETSIKVHLVSI